jgi:hypothetical protein
VVGSAECEGTEMVTVTRFGCMCERGRVLRGRMGEDWTGFSGESYGEEVGLRGRGNGQGFRGKG